jgi:STE24 endopeptidase
MPTDQNFESPTLDEAKQIKAREYSRKRRVLGLAELGLSLAFLLVLIFGGVSKWFTGLLNIPSIAAAVLFFIALILVFEVVTFPLSYYSGFILPHRYGISIQSFKSWLTDQAKGGLISLVLGLAVVAAVFWLLSSFPEFWWLAAWGIMLTISLIITVLAPVFLVPLFYKVKPLQDEELKSRLQSLAEKAGAKVKGIFTLDFSTKVTAANAGLMGMGKTRRIVLSDTLIQQYSLPEIEVITAHEIGHHLHRDIYRLFVIQMGIYLIGFKLTDVVLKAAAVPLDFSAISDPAILPLLALILGTFGTLVSPLTNSYTRHVENQADEYALRLTGDSKSFIDSMTRLVNQNLAVANPPKWEEVLFHDHPCYRKRVEHARVFEKSLSSITLTSEKGRGE